MQMHMFRRKFSKSHRFLVGNVWDWPYWHCACGMPSVRLVSLRIIRLRAMKQVTAAQTTALAMTRYNAEIYVGALLALESRRIAKLLLTEPDQAAWAHAIETENILQKRTTATAARQARLLRRRLTTLDAEGWKMIAERESEVVIQMLMGCSLQAYHTCSMRLHLATKPGISRFMHAA